MERKLQAGWSPVFGCLAVLATVATMGIAVLAPAGVSPASVAAVSTKAIASATASPAADRSLGVNGIEADLVAKPIEVAINPARIDVYSTRPASRRTRNAA